MCQDRGTEKRGDNVATVYVLQGHYGESAGWEDLTAATTRQEILASLRDYQENEGGRYRIRVREEKESD